MINIKDYIRVEKHWVKTLVGLEGEVIGFRESPETVLEIQRGAVVQNLKVRANNYGQQMTALISGKLKNVFAFKPGDVLHLREEQVVVVEKPTAEVYVSRLVTSQADSLF